MKGESSNVCQQKRRYFDREREVGHVWLFNDYFSDEPVYPSNIFRRRFRMRKELFLRIVQFVENHSEYFRMKVDAARKNRLSALQKCTAAIRQVAYGAQADHYDEYIRIGETTMIQCLSHFCQCIYWDLCSTILEKA